MESIATLAYRSKKPRKDDAQDMLRDIHRELWDVRPDLAERIAALYLYFTPRPPKRPRTWFDWFDWKDAAQDMLCDIYRELGDVRPDLAERLAPLYLYFAPRPPKRSRRNP